SLHITTTRDGVVLLHCFAGCSQETVISALLDKGLWSGQSNDARRQTAEIVAKYDYVTADGELAHQTLRLDPKSFRQRRPAPESGLWIWVSLPLNICAWDRRRIGCHSRKPDSPSGQQSASAGHSTQPRWSCTDCLKSPRRSLT